MLRKLLTLLVGVVVTILSYFGVLFIQVANQEIANLTDVERQPPLLVSRVVQTSEQQSINSWINQNFIRTLSFTGPGTHQFARSIYGLFWTPLIPIVLSRATRVAVYLHYLQFEGGSGISYGAKKYFGKNLVDLTEEEIIGLCVISISPKYYSPLNHPDRYKLGLERKKKYYEEMKAYYS